MNTYDTADAAADLLAEQRRARLERADISVAEVTLPTPPYTPEARNNVRTFYAVYQGIDCVGLYDTDDEAYAYAYDLAGACIDGDLAGACIDGGDLD